MIQSVATFATVPAPAIHWLDILEHAGSQALAMNNMAGIATDHVFVSAAAARRTLVVLCATCSPALTLNVACLNFTKLLKLAKRMLQYLHRYLAISPEWK